MNDAWRPAASLACSVADWRTEPDHQHDDDHERDAGEHGKTEAAAGRPRVSGRGEEGH